MSDRNPYPGLRPFRRTESDIFFGREEQTDDLLRRLERNRFLAVVGESGCGKSSLVRAGLIAALESGFLPKAGSRWSTAVMRPGSNPIERLMVALEESEFGDDEFDDGLKGFIRSTLNHGPKGLVNALKRLAMPANTNFLLVVDQFEELFRITRSENREQADAFVSLLLNAVRQAELSIYVVMTMRSDFLGETALFNGLPEAVNDGIYLTPRLSRAQRQASIEGPARVFGGKMEPRVVNRILNEMASDQVQLPLLQHLLMRMWQLADTETVDRDPAADQQGSPARIGKVISEEQYKSAGKLGQALDDHAEEIYSRLPPAQQRIARIIFECLCERSRAGGKVRNIRRPTRIDEIAKIANTDPTQIIAVADRFRASDCNFIAPDVAEEIYPNTKIDLSHESLMLAWKRLSRWMNEESVHNETFDEMLKDALRWETEKKVSRWKAQQHLWDSGARAFRAKAWQDKAESSFRVLRPDDFRLVDRFTKASRKRKRYRFWLFIVAPIILVAVSLQFVWVQAARQGVLQLISGINEEQLVEAAGQLLLDFECGGIVEAIQDSNRRAGTDVEPPSVAEIPALEGNWASRRQELMNSACSVALRDLQKDVEDQTGLLEVFVTDIKGFNVCMSQETSDYVQSDEEWWNDTSNKKEIIIDTVEYDESAGSWSIPIYLPILSGDTVIGIGKAVFDVDNLGEYTKARNCQ